MSEVIAPTDTQKTESALAAYINSVKNDKVNATDKKKAGEAFKALISKRNKLEEQIKALEVEETETAKAMIRAFGRSKVTVEGRDYAPTSRDEHIYYKKLSSGSIEL